MDAMDASLRDMRAVGARAQCWWRRCWRDYVRLCGDTLLLTYAAARARAQLEQQKDGMRQRFAAIAGDVKAFSEAKSVAVVRRERGAGRASDADVGARAGRPVRIAGGAAGGALGDAR